MLVILEGCDGTGKTTLAKSLANVMNAEIIHCSQYTPNDFRFFSAVIEASTKKNIIADRFMYGQFIYQVKEDRHLTLNELHYLETYLLDSGGKVVHVIAPVEEIKERLQERGETLINGLTVEEVQARFRGTFKLSILPVIEWNTGKYQFD